MGGGGWRRPRERKKKRRGRTGKVGNEEEKDKKKWDRRRRKTGRDKETKDRGRRQGLGGTGRKRGGRARWRTLAPKGRKKPGSRGQNCSLCPGERPAEVGWNAPPTSTRSPSRGQDGASHLGFSAALGAGEALAAATASRSDRTTREWEPGARTPGARPDPALPDCSRLRGGASGSPPPRPLPGGACESTQPAQRGAACRPPALCTASPDPPPGVSASAHASQQRGWSGACRCGPRHRVPREVTPRPRRSRPCRCSPALDAATSPWGSGSQVAARVLVRGSPPPHTPGVRAILPPARWAAEPTASLHRRENLPNFVGTVPLLRGLLCGEMAALRQTTVSSATSQKAKVSGNLSTHGSGTRRWAAKGNGFWGGTFMTGLEWARSDRWEEIGEVCQVTRMVAMAARREGPIVGARGSAEQIRLRKGDSWRTEERTALSPCSVLPSVTQSVFWMPVGGRGCRDRRGQVHCFSPGFGASIKRITSSKKKKMFYGKSGVGGKLIQNIH